MSQQSRRDLLRAGLTAGASALLAGIGGGRRAEAVEPIARPASTAPLRLGLAAYSFRQFLDVKKTPRQWTFFDFLEKAAGWGTDGVELTEYYFEKPVTPEMITRLKRQCQILGQTITCTPVGNNFTLPPGEARNQQIQMMKNWIDVSADLGSPCIRVFAGNAVRGLTDEQARKNVVECLEIAGEHAAKRGVFLALENHGGVVARPEGVLEIIKAVQCPWVAVNLDTGNFRTEDPYADMAKIAPYAVVSQFKVMVTANGVSQPCDPARVVKILRDVGYHGFLSLEYEEREDPLVAVPRHLEALRKALG
jgi:sugar phosphate isomerase/epimerase